MGRRATMRARQKAVKRRPKFLFCDGGALAAHPSAGTWRPPTRHHVIRRYIDKAST